MTGADTGVTDEVRALIRTALDEDLRYGPDITTVATIPADAVVDAAIVSRDHGVVAGVGVARAVFDEVIGADRYEVTAELPDGHRVEPGRSCWRCARPPGELLTAERTALNLLCHLSGIATATSAWVEAVEGPARRSATPARRCRGCASAEGRRPGRRWGQPPHGSG